MTTFLEKAGLGLFGLMTAGAVLNLGVLGTQITVNEPGPAKTAAVAATAETRSVIETPKVADTSDAAAPETGADVTQVVAHAGPDAKAGEKVFAKCKSCHTLAKGAKNGVGPNLWGLIGRPVASHEGFAYSDAMKSLSGQSWTAAFLDTYLTDVKGTVKGTKMSFAGLPRPENRTNLIAFLAQNSDAPIAADALGLEVAAAPTEQAAGAASSNSATGDTAAEAAAPAAVTYSDLPGPSAEEVARDEKAATALAEAIKGIDRQRAKYHPLHFKPAIDTASNAECLMCHREVLEAKVRESSLAGLTATDALAWYQTLATYDGPQMTFHQRHMTSPYAQSVMSLKCTFCHQGNDPREEAPQMTVAEADMTSNNGAEPFTLRKMVNPSETCLRCHGAMPDPVNIMGLPGPWPEARKDLENAETPNGCLTCHGELFRTSRHKVTYLNAATIEDLAKESSDVCYGCHGGRAWYRTSYPYPRHPWPGMDASTVPDWAKDRKAESDPRYAIKDPAQ